MKKYLLFLLLAFVPFFSFSQYLLTEVEEQCLSSLSEAGYSFENTDSFSVETYRQCGKNSYEKKDFSDAAYWFDKAARSGDILSYTMLGLMHQIGEGFNPSEEEAFKYFVVSAASGETSSQLFLGNLYYMADDMDVCNHHRARFWWQIAANAGNENAIQNLKSCFPKCQFGSFSENLRQHTSTTLKAKGYVNDDAQLNYLLERKERELVFIMITKFGGIMVGNGDIFEGNYDNLDAAILEDINFHGRFIKNNELCCIIIDHMDVSEQSDAAYKAVCQSLERIRSNSKNKYIVFDSEFGPGRAYAERIGGKIKILVPPPPPAPDVLEMLIEVDD